MRGMHTPYHARFWTTQNKKYSKAQIYELDVKYLRGTNR